MNCPFQFYLLLLFFAFGLLGPGKMVGQSEPMHGLVAPSGHYLPSDTTVLFSQLAQIERDANAMAPPSAAAFFAERYAKRTAAIRASVLDSSYIFQEDITGYLSEIYGEIIANNELKVAPLILVSRSPNVNAASLGDGIFVVDIGLLSALGTREELAFVAGHELAHDQLLHLRARLLKLAARAQQQEDSERKARRSYRKLIRREGRGRVMQNLRDLVYADYRHSRQNELSADSLGIIYLEAAKLLTATASSSLERINDYNPFVVPSDEIPRLLQTKDYPFKDRWTASPKTMFGGSFGSKETSETAGFWQRDSLSTHPDLPERQQQLDQLLPDGAQAVSGEPHPFLEMARRETIITYIRYQRTAHALCLSLAALANGAEDTDGFYASMVGEALLGTHQSIEAQDFDKAVPPSRYFKDEGARAVTRILQQIRASELRKLTTAYLNDKTGQLPTSYHLRLTQSRVERYFTFLDNQ